MVGPALVNVGGGTFKLNELPVDDTDAPVAAVVVSAIVGVMSGAVLVIIEPEVMLMPVPFV